jgi:hypothetical protein
MLVIKTFLSQSKIFGAGAGLFSSQNVKKGEPVAISIPGTYFTFTEEEFQAADPDFKNFLTDYSCCKDGVWILEKDNEKFINHSRNPNLTPAGFARRDIEAGEELTYDYREVDDLIEKFPPPWL